MMAEVNVDVTAQAKAALAAVTGLTAPAARKALELAKANIAYYSEVNYDGTKDLVVKDGSAVSDDADTQSKTDGTNENADSVSQVPQA